MNSHQSHSLKKDATHRGDVPSLFSARAGCAGGVPPLFSASAAQRSTQDADNHAMHRSTGGRVSLQIQTRSPVPGDRHRYPT
ncbi:hypothetical protein [Rubripirellula obstinata]|uniref:hypothetical protein n=1 Tax=Rubripirellula obstinata TaxID=406547 RepID=UPI00082D8308|nr:hypothetical protein [Rubripirellula obstinata]